MRTIAAALRFASLFVYVLCCLFVIAFLLPGRSPEQKGRVIGRWARRLVRWLGVRVETSGAFEDALVHDCGVTPGRIGRLLCANHCSVLDVFVLNGLAPSSFVAKAEIARWPVFGMIASAVGTIFIERGNKRALLSIAERMERALGEGRSLLLFPEGTTSDGTGLLPLHANLMQAAAATGAPVIPIVLRYKSGDKITTRAAYVGDTGLFTCLWRILRTPDFKVEVKILEPVCGDNRHAICREVSAAMCRAIGVVDPLAAAAAVHGTPAVRPQERGDKPQAGAQGGEEAASEKHT